VDALQQTWALMILVLGAGCALAAYLGAVAIARGMRRRETEEHGSGPIPILMWALYLGMALFMIGYLVWAAVVRPNY
jgi:hypothetical protein